MLGLICTLVSASLPPGNTRFFFNPFPAAAPADAAPRFKYLKQRDAMRNTPLALERRILRRAAAAPRCSRVVAARMKAAGARRLLR